ncbi:MAG: sigma 54-interacting transcriptional regulator [Myxococcota bacterium]|nr:sigma 54-interacting transcriptional regulator [Myxococcota bacterium]MDW8362347.1 sigma 54-interacting transcriptional regulator [Myxococcales bacterium]
MSLSTELRDLERLPGVVAASAILREAFGVSLLVTGPEGPPAHRSGGTIVPSSDVCRVALFQPDSFEQCDRFYAAIGAESGPGSRSCPLGLAAMHVPVLVEGETIAHVVASGFSADALRGCAPVDMGRLAADLARIDPTLEDPGAVARKLPVVRGDRHTIVRVILEVAAREMAEHETRRRRRRQVAPSPASTLGGMVGACSRMLEVFELIERVAASDAPVLVRGESGTGKELVARAIHAASPRASGPFVAQSCAAVPDELLESVLFGHVRGAFSGAVRASEGLFGAARGGTLFLDEVGEMSAAMQGKLLRVLSDGSYLPVGATTPRRAEVRVIAASHRDLAQAVAAGSFRQDLFFRLAVLRIELPPLRERPGDVRLLVDAFLREQFETPPEVGAEAFECLERYAWPGNVRELRAEVQRWAALWPDVARIEPEHLSEAVRAAGGYGATAPDAATPRRSLHAELAAYERELLARAWSQARGDLSAAAARLGLDPADLEQRLSRYGIARRVGR